MELEWLLLFFLAYVAGGATTWLLCTCLRGVSVHDALFGRRRDTPSSYVRHHDASRGSFPEVPRHDPLVVVVSDEPSVAANGV